MKKEIKDIFLRITGKGMLEKELTMFHNYVIRTEVHIKNVTERGNEDGSINLTYSALQDGKAIIENDKGER